MMKKQPDYAQRRYSYKVLLYAENRSHMSVLRLIKREYSENYVGCWHVEKDEDGAEIVQGNGKKHCHIVLHFENARSYGAVCRSLGFVRDGMPDGQFLHPIGYKDDGTRVKWETFEKGLAYLTHANTPDKPQIDTKYLFGAKKLVTDAQIAAERERALCSSQSVCVWHIKEWIRKQPDFVTYSMLADYLCDNPYFKGSSSRIVYGCMEEHNRRVQAAYMRDRCTAYEVAAGTDYGQITRSAFLGLGHIEDDDWMTFDQEEPLF